MSNISLLKKFYAVVLASVGFSCQTGHLTVVSVIPNNLKEASAIEIVEGSELMWMIEDAGNKNNLYGLDQNGSIVKDFDIDNVQNIDWEDLTSDDNGNIYIGEFGNNSKKRKRFAIFKISNILNHKDKNINAKVISFELPKKIKSKDFESFFIYKDHFYLFSKAEKQCELFRVPNVEGHHIATFISKLKLKGKNTKVTSADISKDGATVVLLNHDKMLVLKDYESDNFFSGQLTIHPFKHDSQKEGITIVGENHVLINDERDDHEGGKVYSFEY